jgi:hypothetical protein
MFGQDSGWWNVALLTSLAIAALASAGTVFATYAVITTQNAEAKAAADSFARYKLGVEARVAEATAKGVAAGTAAAGANVRAAEANREAQIANAVAATAREQANQAELKLATMKERIAEAERDAARARLALAKLTTNVGHIATGLSSRHLSAAQREIIVLLDLKKLPIIIQADNSGEEESFARELDEVLQAAGASVTLRTGNTILNGSVGLIVRFDKSDRAAASVFDALEKTQLHPEAVQAPAPAYS